MAARIQAPALSVAIPPLTGDRTRDAESLLATLKREAGMYYFRPGYDWHCRRRIVLYLEPNCRDCGRRAWEVDHIQPRACGGSDAWENLQPLCCACHHAKTARARRNGDHA